MIPTWLHLLSIVAVATGLLCAVLIAADEWRDPQHMWIMNVVWPASALYAGPLALWGYRRWGKLASHRAMQEAERRNEPMPSMASPFAVKVGKGATHCGSGCALGDLCAEWIAFAIPTVAVWFGWHSLFAEKMFAVWILDYILAFGFGIAFQYFTIKPMRGLSPAEGLWQAVKADTLSLTAWQIGMYGFMAIAHFWIFAGLFGAEVEVASFEFWFAMQIAMLCGFMTAYPVNWWLVKRGIKEAM
ncbi:DUF4396 domain-containing protein [Aurantimonas sp. MSK8Z-1]|uniref:DUF4396 domain-containing protein n=1 Tax=Mangrovibrevibacter kandeliae TaxID=2968473 RepID=UPI002118ECE4|nr:DUF4396 domain-containing protein [Aurantimonas sp. MSK8Z-1]MCW4116719.1 DUF4396 domain-containing protein [Aurantimonas sp. MSK8Z-1]